MSTLNAPDFITAWRESIRKGKRNRKFTIEVVLCECKRSKYHGLKHVYFLIKEHGEEDKSSGPAVFSQVAARAHLQGLQVSGYMDEARVEELMREVATKGITEDFAKLFMPPQPNMEQRFFQEHLADDLRSFIR